MSDPYPHESSDAHRAHEPESPSTAPVAPIMPPDGLQQPGSQQHWGPPASAAPPGWAPAPGQWAPPPGQWAPPPGQWAAPPGQGQWGNAMPAATAYQVAPYGFDSQEWIPELQRSLAPPWVRVGAKALDVLFIMIVQMAISFAVLPLTLDAMSSSMESGSTGGYSMFSSPPELLGLTLALGAFQLLVDFVFNPVITARFGGTPGKLICGLRVIRRDGRTLDLLGATRRWSPYAGLRVVALIPVIGFFGSFASLGYAIANLAMIFANDRHVDLNDMIGDTYVVRR